ncbi:unnamed protein product, partial [Phaeothamnion confervicola]
MLDGLVRAFLFHEDLYCTDENASNEEALAEVLWYHGRADEKETERRRHVAMARALISFAVGFPRRPEAETQSESASAKTRIEFARTREHCHGFLRCAEGVWMVFVVQRRGTLRSTQRKSASLPATGDWVDEAALQAAMIRAYETFTMLHGCIANFLASPPSPPPPMQTPQMPQPPARGQDGGDAIDGISAAAVSARLSGAEAAAGGLPHEPPAAVAADAGLLADAAVAATAGAAFADAAAAPATTRLEAARREVAARAGLRRLREQVAVAEGGADDELLHRQLAPAEAELVWRLAAAEAVAPLVPLRRALAAFFRMYLSVADLGRLHCAQDMAGFRLLPLKRDLYVEVRRLQQRLREELSPRFGGDGGGGGPVASAFAAATSASATGSAASAASTPAISVLVGHGAHLVWAGPTPHEAALLYHLLRGLGAAPDPPPTGALVRALSSVTTAAGADRLRAGFGGRSRAAGFLRCDGGVEEA